MIITIRHWLSAVFVGWAINILPNGATKYWLNYGVQVAIKGMESEVGGAT